MKSDESNPLDLSKEALLMPIAKYGMLVKITKIEILNDNSICIEYDADSVQMREEKIDSKDLDAEVEKILLEAITREGIEELDK